MVVSKTCPFCGKDAEMPAFNICQKCWECSDCYELNGFPCGKCNRSQRIEEMEVKKRCL